MKKGKQDISKVILKGVLLTGVFVAILAMSTTSMQISQFLCDSQDVEQTADDDRNEEHEVLKSLEAITTSAQISLEQEFLLIDVLPDLIKEEQEFVSSNDHLPAGNKVLKILFRLIISPNAP